MGDFALRKIFLKVFLVHPLVEVGLVEQEQLLWLGKKDQWMICEDGAEERGSCFLRTRDKEVWVAYLRHMSGPESLLGTS